jgi:uncharacterized membrane protein
MQGRLWTAINAVRASYWFVPGVMTLIGIVLGAVAVWVDASLDHQWLDELAWYQAARASGAREVLSAIAGSMITVAGVVFSITIVALSYASAQYGPRVLTNFMSDRGNTITLGTFLATFVYCIVVLRTIRSGEEGGFVPQIAVLLALLLALCSIGVLIYFINHVPRTIHVNTVIAGIGEQLLGEIDRRFPKRIGGPARDRGAAGEPWAGPPAAAAPFTLTGAGPGYIQKIDGDLLLSAAERADILIRLRRRPGDFVSGERVLLDIWPAGAIDDQTARNLRSAFVVSSHRTPFGDLYFLVDELVEIAARALSTGVNDPMTAIICIDWLGAALEKIAGREPPDPLRCGGDGKIRVVAPSDGFEQILAASFGQLRHHASTSPIAAERTLLTLREVSRTCSDARQAAALAREQDLLLELVAINLKGPSRERVVSQSEGLGRGGP